MIGRNAFLRNVEIWIEDDNNSVSIGEKCRLTGYTHLAAIEGTEIRIAFLI